LERLPADFPWPIVIAQHMPATFTGPLARRLDGLTAVHVQEVVRPTQLSPGVVYLARGDADMIVVRRDGRLVAMSVPASANYRWRPSVDRLAESVLAVVPAAQIVGVLLTGMGDDGAASLAQVRAGGGHTIAESASSAVVYGMPRALAEAGGASEVVDLGDIGERLFAAVVGP
jgi:two-component system chemotaxis response regulator CheB